VIYDRIEWDEYNLTHATLRLTAAQIEQVIRNATRAIPHRSIPDRVLFRAVTDGGVRALVIAEIVRDGVRPITGWKE
jgi:hypothetical protein